MKLRELVIETVNVEEQRIKDWLKKNVSVSPSSFIVEPDGVSCKTQVRFDPYGTKPMKDANFPFKWKHIDGSFSLYISGLSTIENLPESIDGYLELTACEKLTSLQGIHKVIKKVRGDIRLYGTPIKRNILGLILIEGVTKINGLLTNVDKNSPKIKAFSIVNKYLGKGKAGVLEAQEKLIEAGLDEFAEL